MGDREEAQLAEAQAHATAAWKNVEDSAAALLSGVIAWWPEWIVDIARSQIRLHPELAKKIGRDGVQAFKTYVETMAGKAEQMMKRFCERPEVLEHLQGQEHVAIQMDWYTFDVGRNLEEAVGEAAGLVGLQLMDDGLIPNEDSRYWRREGRKLWYNQVQLSADLQRCCHAYSSALRDARKALVAVKARQVERDQADADDLWT